MANPLDHRIRVAALRREEMQLHLLLSGLELASAHSIHALEVEDVVRQAGVSRGTFYKYFPSIPGLYGALSRQLMLEVAAMMDDLVPHGVDAATRLASTIRISLRLFVDVPMLGRFFRQIQWPSQGDDHDIFHVIVRDVQAGIREGVFTNMPVSIGASIAIGSLMGGVHTLLVEGDQAGFEDSVAHQVLIGLGVDAASASHVSRRALPCRPLGVAPGILGKLAEMGVLHAGGPQQVSRRQRGGSGKGRP